MFVTFGAVLQKRAEGLNDRSVTVDLPEIISAVQKALGVEVDGTAGPETWNAIYNRICRGKAGPPRKTSVAASAAKWRERVIVWTTAARKDRDLIAASAAVCAGFGEESGPAWHDIIGVLRTYEEQNELFAQEHPSPTHRDQRARRFFES